MATTPMLSQKPFTTKLNKIEYWEAAGNTEQFRDDDASISRRFFTRWKDSFKFVRDMVGSAKVVGSKLSRDLPEVHPERAYLYACEAHLVGSHGFPSVDPLADPKNAAIWWSAGVPKLDTFVGTGELKREADGEGLAEYEVTYQSNLYDLLEDTKLDASLKERSRFVIPNLKPAAQNLPIPNRLLYYEGTDRPIGQAGVQLFPTANLTLQWVRVPIAGVPFQTMHDMQGMVNGPLSSSPSWDIRWPRKGKIIKYPPETLMFLGCDPRIYIDRNMEVFADLTYHYEYRRTGHNKFLDWNSGKFLRVIWKQNPVVTPARSLHELGNFDDLFDVSKP